MGTLVTFTVALILGSVAADTKSELPTKKRFDVELKRSVAISDAPEDSGHNEELETLSLNFGFDHEEKDSKYVDKRFDIYKRFEPFRKRFDPFQKRFDLYKRFDPYQKRFDVYKRFDPLEKRFDPYMMKSFDVYKRFDPFQKRFDLYKRFDPFSKRFDPLYKRFDPYMKKRFDREETVRNLIRSLSESKRNIIDPRAFNIGFGR